VPRSKRVEVGVDGRTLSLSNLDKVLYPEAGFTKGQVIEYVSRIAPYVLPHLTGRALTLKRYPNGVEQGHFYEKNAPAHRPDWVPTTEVGGIRYVRAEDRATLVWLANLADLEWHPSLALAARPQTPTVLAFDLDPGEGTDVMACAQVALLLRHALTQLGLQGWPKSSGSKGMQVYVPLHDDALTFADTKTFSRALAQVLERTHPELVVSDMAKVKRRGKVLVDWSQNDEHKTTVAVYSLRARPQPTASAPVTWAEVEGAGTAADLTFTAAEVLDRAAEHGDLWAEVATLRQALPSLTG
jgi:bifunctional non-homologous end joining protein LigD